MRASQPIEYGPVAGLRAGRSTNKVNTSVVCYRLGQTLIDSGAPLFWREVRGFCDTVPPAQVLLTHHHEDHSGNAGRIARRYGAAVYAPAWGIERLRRGFSLRMYQVVFWGRPRKVPARPLPPRFEAEDGWVFEAVPAPGHSPDMTAILEPNRGYLFSGDLFIVSRPTHLRVDENVGEMIESLERVLEREWTVLFCAHRGPLEDGRAQIAAKRDYLIELRGQVRALHGRGKDVEEIAHELLGEEDFASRFTRGHFTKANLVRGCLESG